MGETIFFSQKGPPPFGGGPAQNRRKNAKKSIFTSKNPIFGRACGAKFFAPPIMGESPNFQNFAPPIWGGGLKILASPIWGGTFFRRKSPPPHDISPRRQVPPLAKKMGAKVPKIAHSPLGFPQCYKIPPAFKMGGDLLVVPPLNGGRP